MLVVFLRSFFTFFIKIIDVRNLANESIYIGKMDWLHVEKVLFWSSYVLFYCIFFLFNFSLIVVAYGLLKKV